MLEAMDGEEPAREEPSAPRMVLDSDGNPIVDYEVGHFITPMGVTIQCIVVSAVDSRFLVAFPHQVWHRTVAKRVLPPQALAKPTLVEVLAAEMTARDAPLDERPMRVWMGYITDEIEAVDPYTHCDYVFKADAEEGFLPYAGSLVEALTEHFAFVSAESGATAPPQKGAGTASLQGRVDQLERMIGQMAENVQTLLEREPLPPAGRPPKVTFAPTPKIVPGAPSKQAAVEYPGLDQSVVSAAMAAGISGDSLREMARMMSSDVKGARRLREPALRPSQVPRSSAAVALSESDEEVEDPGVEQQSGYAERSSSSTMENALKQLTELVGILSADKVKKAKTSKMEAVLDQVSGSTTSDGSGGSTLKRAAAARRALRQALVDSPEEIYGIVEKLMLEDLTMQMQTPNMPAVTLNARAWVEHRSKIGAYKATAHGCWGVAGILDDLIAGRTQHARARAALMILQFDQVSIDRGSWALAAELSLEQQPPFSSLAMHALPNVMDGESPYSRLLDSRWAEVMLAHLKDAEEYVQRRRTLGKKITQAALEDSHAEAKPKARPKAKNKSQQEAGADA